METKEVIKQFQLDYQFGLQSRTLRRYIHTVNQFLAFVEKPIDSIAKRDIRNWLKKLSETGYKTTSIQTKLIGLKTFFKYCREEEFTQGNPAETVPFPKQEETLPRYLTREQLTQLRELVEGKLLERTIVEVLVSTGVRISELAAMKKEDINWSERSILIPQGKGKKGRIVLFHSACAEHLKAYLNSRMDDLPFVLLNPRGTTSIRTGWINKKFEGYSNQLGVHVTPHMLRHTFTAQLAQKGMPIEAIRILLGHDSPHTTQLYARLYDHARKEQYDEWM